MSIDSADNKTAAAYDFPADTVRSAVFVVGDESESSLVVKFPEKAMENASTKEAFQPIAIGKDHFCSSMQLRKAMG